MHVNCAAPVAVAGAPEPELPVLEAVANPLVEAADGLAYTCAQRARDIDQVPLALATLAPDGHLQFPKTGTIPRINPTYSRIAATLWDDYSTYHALVTDVSSYGTGATMSDITFDRTTGCCTLGRECQEPF